LHLLQDDALLHLADIFLLDNTHQGGELLKDKVWVELRILTHALGQETFATFLGQQGDGVRWLRVDKGSEAELSLDVTLALLTLIDSLAELLGVLVIEEEGKAGDVLDGRGFTNLNLVLFNTMVVVEDFDRTPKILTTLKAR
jgi:hypothetical protein